MGHICGDGAGRCGIGYGAWQGVLAAVVPIDEVIRGESEE